MNEEQTLIEVFKEVSIQVKKISKFRLTGIILLLIYGFVKLSGIQEGMEIRSTAQAIMVLVFELGFPLVGIILIVWSSLRIRKLKMRLYQTKVERDQLVDKHGL